MKADVLRLMPPQTALHKAVEAGHGEVVEMLLAAGANDQLEDARGRTVADIDSSLVLPSSRLALEMRYEQGTLV